MPLTICIHRHLFIVVEHGTQSGAAQLFQPFLAPGPCLSASPVLLRPSLSRCLSDPACLGSCLTFPHLVG